jgi:hypothetical protein
VFLRLRQNNTAPINATMITIGPITAPAIQVLLDSLVRGTFVAVAVAVTRTLVLDGVGASVDEAGTTVLMVKELEDVVVAGNSR